MGEIVNYDERVAPLSVAQLRDNVRLIQEVMRSVMQSGEHYGVIPGCGSKPVLLKSGAEKIASTFRLCFRDEVLDLSGPDVARYRVTVFVTSADGHFLGTGVGEASTDEAKYRWRAPTHPDEFHATPEGRRRIKFGRNGEQIPQVRTDPADHANTVMKMARKRASVAAVLTVTAASDIFTQDLEDADEPTNANTPDAPRKRTNASPPQPVTPPPNESIHHGAPPPPDDGVRRITGPQGKRLFAIWQRGPRSDQEVRARLQSDYGITDSRQLPAAVYDEFCAWLEGDSDEG